VQRYLIPPGLTPEKVNIKHEDVTLFSLDDIKGLPLQQLWQPTGGGFHSQ
jgi:hypothetical protein